MHTFCGMMTSSLCPEISGKNDHTSHQYGLEFVDQYKLMKIYLCLFHSLLHCVSKDSTDTFTEKLELGYIHCEFLN